MSSLLVTVLMSVRNGEPYVETAVRSILNQTYGAFKFLILDNASTDRTVNTVRSLKDPRIELILLERDLGHTGALNRGLQKVNTPYVARMDADDIAHPLRLERQMNFLRENPEVVLLGTGYEAIDSTGRILSRHIPESDYSEILKGMLFENQFAHSSVVYDLQTVMAIGGYDPRVIYAQDYALWWRIALTHPVANLPEPLLKFRMHPNQGTQTFKARAVEELYHLILGLLAESQAFDELRPLNRQARGYAELKYAAGIAENGDVLRPFFHLLKGLGLSPTLCSNPTARRYIARTLLRKRGFDLLKQAKQRLWSHRTV